MRNNADTLIYGTESTLREFRGRLDPEARERVRLALDECKYVVGAETDNLNRLRESLGRLDTEAHKLFASLQDLAGFGGRG